MGPGTPCRWGPCVSGATGPAGWLKVLGRDGPARSWKEKGPEVTQVLFQGRNRDAMLLSSVSQVGISVGRWPSATLGAEEGGGTGWSGFPHHSPLPEVVIAHNEALLANPCPSVVGGLWHWRRGCKSL